MLRQKKACVLLSFIAIISIYSFYSCKKTGTGTTSTDSLIALNLPATPFNYANQSLPAFMRTPIVSGQINNPGNPITDWGATLGRVLFYDKTISVNNTIACAGCHQQRFGFADNKAFSIGFAGGLTGRNSMQLINAQYYPPGRYFWDERAATLEDQTL